MGQTTTGIPRSNYKIEVSTNGSTWIDVSGQSASVNVSGGDQTTGEQPTADGNAPVVIGTNKTAAKQLECNVLYTETSGEAFQTVWARYEGATKTLYVRYSPDGGDVGDERYTAVDDAGNAFACPIINCLPPNVDAGSGDPAMASFTVLCPKLAQAAVT